MLEAICRTAVRASSEGGMTEVLLLLQHGLRLEEVVETGAPTSLLAATRGVPSESRN